jgi:hypothetical protein
MIRRSLALTHSGFGRLGGNWFVRENAYPDVAAAPQMVRDCPSRGLDLAGVDPRRFQGYKPNVAEVDLASAGGLAPAAPSMHLSIFDALGHQHI